MLRNIALNAPFPSQGRGKGGRGAALFLLLLLLALAATGAAPRRQPVTLYLFLSTRCPISNRYAPRLAALAARYGAKGVRIVGVYSETDITVADMRRHAAEHGLRFPTVLDPSGQRARRFGAKVTPEAAVLDPAGALRYLGRIDDSDDPSRATTHDLRDALDSLLASRPAPHPRTRAFGCAIQPAQTPNTLSAPPSPGFTYADDIASILNQNCVSCHRAGQIGPMPLTTYKQATAWAAQIKLVTASRQMPPWKANSHGEFLGEHRLTPGQIGALAAWADAGMPEGDPKRTPTAPAFPKSEWPLGEPDAVFTMSTAYTVSADGKDIYRCFVLPTHYDADRWVAAIAFAPGNKAVVHHATVFLDDSGAARRLDAADPGPGYTNPTPGNGPGYPTSLWALGGWTPGHQPWRLPTGVAELLPKGADLVLEVHYHADGKSETDKTRFGLYFARGPVEKRLRMGDVSSHDFRIPPGAKDCVVNTTATLPFDITVLSVTPHMHNLGRAMKVTATLPDGTHQPIIDVENWDFNWQPSYRYRTPLKLPQGTRIDLTAHFDNTAENPAQPNRPPREVRWGESTTAEMCTCFFAYTRDDEHRTEETVIVR